MPMTLKSTDPVVHQKLTSFTIVYPSASTTCRGVDDVWPAATPSCQDWSPLVTSAADSNWSKCYLLLPFVTLENADVSMGVSID